MKKRFLTKAISVVLVLLMMSTMVGEVIPFAALAAPTLDYIDTIKSEKQGSAFVVLEIVPEAEQSSMGFYAKGQEPTAPWLEALAGLDTRDARLAYMNGSDETSITSKLTAAGILSKTTDTPLTATNDLYTEKYPWEAETSGMSVLYLNDTCQTEVTGQFVEDTENGQFNIDESLSSYVIDPINGTLVQDTTVMTYASSASANSFYYSVEFTKRDITPENMPDEGECIYVAVYQDEPVTNNVVEPETEEETPAPEEPAEEPEVKTEEAPVLDEAVNLDAEPNTETAAEAFEEPEPQIDAEENIEENTEENVEENTEENTEENAEEPAPEPPVKAAEGGSANEAERIIDHYELFCIYSSDDEEITFDLDADYFIISSVSAPREDWFEGCYTPVSQIFREADTEHGETPYFRLDHRGYEYVGNGLGTYALQDGSDEYSVRYDRVYYRFGFTNNEWFLRYVMDCDEEDLGDMAVYVWSYTPEQLSKRSGSIYNADLIVLSGGFSALGASGKYSRKNDISESCLDALYAVSTIPVKNRCPVVLDTSLFSGLSETEMPINLKEYYDTLFAMTNGFVTAGGLFQNVFFFDSSDFSADSLVQAGFYRTEIEGVDDESPYGIVLSAIRSANEGREAGDKIDEKVTEATCFRQVIDFAGQLIGNKKDILRVLMIQPMKEGTALGTGELTEDYIREHLLPKDDPAYTSTKIEDIKISIQTISILEFVGRTEDLISNYDMIIIGSSTEGFATKSDGTTDFNDNTLDGLLYSSVGDVYRSSIVPASDFGLSSGITRKVDDYRAGGNDLTQLRAEELKYFAEAGLPVILSTNLVKSSEDEQGLRAWVTISADTALDEKERATLHAELGYDDGFNPDDYNITYQWLRRDGTLIYDAGFSSISDSDSDTLTTDFNLEETILTIHTQRPTQFQCKIYLSPKNDPTADPTELVSNVLTSDTGRQSNTYKVSLSRSGSSSKRTYTLSFDKEPSEDVTLSWSRRRYISWENVPDTDSSTRTITVNDSQYSYRVSVSVAGYRTVTLTNGDTESLTRTWDIFVPTDDKVIVPKTIVLPETGLIPDDDRVDKNSYMYDFIESCLKKNLSNVRTLSQALENPSDTLMYLNSCSCPEMKITSVGGQSFDESKKDTVITLDSSDIEVNFDLDNPTDPTPVSTRYTFHFYIDLNGDGFFSDDEEQDTALVNWGRVEKDELKAGVTYTIYFPLDGMAGILPWQLELIKNGKDKDGREFKYVHATETGYCYYEPLQPDEISVLHICSDDDLTATGSELEFDKTISTSETSGGNGYTRTGAIITTDVTENYYHVVDNSVSSALANTSGAFYTLLNELNGASVSYEEVYNNTTKETGRTTVVKDTSYDYSTRRYTKTQKRTDTVVDHYTQVPHIEGYVGLEGGKKDYHLSIDVKAAGSIKSKADINDYDVLILGFGEGYKELSANAAKWLAECAKSGKAIVVSHDTFSAAVGIDKNTRWSQASTSRQYNVMTNDDLLEAFGLDLYDEIDKGVENTGLQRYGIIGRIINWITPKARANEVNGYTRHTIVRYLDQNGSDSRRGFLGGLINFIRNILGGEKQRDTKELPNNTAAHTQTVTELNHGRVTTYPYNLNTDDALTMSDTFEPYYQLNLNRGDTSVWYCLSGGVDRDPESGLGYYDDAKNDAVNCYYLYSKQNVYYIGTCFSKDTSLKNTFTEDEAKLLINTLIASYNTAKYMEERENLDKKPSVSFISDTGVTMTSMLVAADNGDGSSGLSFLAENEITVDFRITPPKGLENALFSIALYNNNDTEHPFTGGFEIRDAQGHTVTDLTRLQANTVYTLVLYKPGQTNSLLSQLFASGTNAVLSIEAHVTNMDSSYTSDRFRLTIREYGLRELT